MGTQRNNQAVGLDRQIGIDAVQTFPLPLHQYNLLVVPALGRRAVKGNVGS